VVGETLNDRYRIERRLGGGSQAEVFLATDVHMERLVAIKIWKPEGGFTVDEFLREAKLLARFGAPRFVTIHEHAATIDQRPFFVLEYLQGETLQDLTTPLTGEEIARCVRDICVGLQKAHDEGVVHRDLKPSNIMLVDRGQRTERYVILDLGIAKITDTTNWRQTLADATMAGAGTLLYMSPEQCNGNPIDQRTDIYAFGCLLFTLLAHEEPFAHKTGSHLSVLNAILSDPPRRLAEVRPESAFPEDLEQLVQDCLAKKPEDRPASMTEVEARFQECSPDYALFLSTGGDGPKSGPGTSGIRTRRPTGSKTHPKRKPKRRVAVLGLLGLSLAAASSFAFFLARPDIEAKIFPKAAPDLTASQVASSLPVHQADPPPVQPTQPLALRPTDPVTTTPLKPPSTGPVDTRTARTEPKPPVVPVVKVPEKTSPEKTPPEKTPSEKMAAVKPPLLKTPAVKPPDPPPTNDDRYVVVRNRTLKTDDPFGKGKDPSRYGVLANDGLPSGKPYEAECVDKPRFGTLTFNKDGSFTYAGTARPEGEVVRADSFTYRVRASAKEPWSEPASVAIVIRPFSDEEETDIKRIDGFYGDAAIRRDEHPPGVTIDFSELTVKNEKKRVHDDSLAILDGLAEVLRELRLDSQPITDTALARLRRFDELRILSLAGTDVSAAGLLQLASLKNLTEVDLSDTLLSEGDVAAFATRGRTVPLHVLRDGAIDRLKNAGVAIAAKNDVTLGRNGFVATVPLGNFQKVGLLLRDAPRLVAIVLSTPDLGDALLTENWVGQFKSLKALDLRGTIVSPQRIEVLRRQFPGVQLQWDTPLKQLRAVAGVTQSGDGPVSIDFSGKKIDGRTWILLSQLDKLNSLNLSGVALDEVGFSRLLQLKTLPLRELTLQETTLTGPQVLEVCRQIPSLVSVDVQKSPIAGNNNELRAILAELSHGGAKGVIHPEPAVVGPALLTAPFNKAAAVQARTIWAGYLNSPEQWVNSIGMKLQLIPPGEFRMGSEDTYLELIDRYPNVREAEEENPVSRLALESARPQHAVRITGPYYLGAYEVTNEQFKKFVDATGRKPNGAKAALGAWGVPAKNPPNDPKKSSAEGRGVSKGYWGSDAALKVPPGKPPEAPAKPPVAPAKPPVANPAVPNPSPQAPVVNVTWDDAVAFCEWLSLKEKDLNRFYRLPTEAEWEYACRAGTISRYWKDDDPEHLTLIGNVRDLAAKQKFGWQNTLNSSDGAAETCDVGRYPPNNFDLFDMHGNAAEWCSDWFSRSYYRQSPQANPSGPSTGVLRVVRGGSWHSSGIFSRSAHRVAEPPTHYFDRIGFRVVCVERRAPWPPVLASVVPPAGLAPKSLVAPFDEQQVGDARKAWAQYEHVDDQITDFAGLKLILIPPGEFGMGATDDEIAQASKIDPTFKKASAHNEQPFHNVRITRPFYLSAHEVTRGQFARFMHATGYKSYCERPSGPSGVGFDQANGKFKTDRKYNWHNTAFPQDDTHPVVNVTWRDATAFCLWLTWQEGKKYRLPTEAEWEYACRAGTTTLYSSGDDPEALATISNVADETAKATFSKWHAIKAPDGYVFTAPVGSFKPNAFGLFDMHGNVREWCGDWSAEDYYARSPATDPPGAAAGKQRVIRGGAWTTNAAGCRSASRSASDPSRVALSLGFRVAVDPPAQ
jgi:sulfatase modifying factor 1